MLKTKAEEVWVHTTVLKTDKKKMQETKMCLLLSKRHAKNNFSISFDSVVILLDKTKFL